MPSRPNTRSQASSERLSTGTSSKDGSSQRSSSPSRSGSPSPSRPRQPLARPSGEHNDDSNDLNESSAGSDGSDDSNGPDSDSTYNSSDFEDPEVAFYMDRIKKLLHKKRPVPHRTNIRVPPAAARRTAAPLRAPDSDREINRLKEKIETLKAEKASLKDALDTLRQQRDEANVEAANAIDCQEVLQADFNELQDKVATLSEELTTTKQQLADAQGKQLVTMLAKPTPFSGSKQDKLDIRDWLQSIHDYTSSTRLAKSEQQRIQIAESYLQGEAKRSWLITRSAMNNGSDNVYADITFEAFKEALVKRWDPACTEVVAQHRLDQLKQRGSLPDFVAEFDKLCSYVPDMQDREKVHRFLTSINSDLVDMVSTDPTTRQRWTKYEDLRSYALNHAAAAAATALPAALRPHGHHNRFKRRQDALASIANAAQAGAKRPRSFADVAAAGGGAVGGAAGAGSSRQAQQRSGRLVEYKNAKGMAFSRHPALVRWCHGNSVCLTCYEKYTPATASQHRHNCTKTPAKGLPNGYSIPRG